MGTCTTSLHVTMVGMEHVRCVFTLPVCGESRFVCTLGRHSPGHVVYSQGQP